MAPIEQPMRFGELLQRHRLAAGLSQEELAEMIGSSRPMVSKLLSEMAQRAMIACQGRHYILLRGSGLEVAPRWPNPAFSRPVVDNMGEGGLRAPVPAERSGGHFPGRLSDRADRAA